MRMLVNRTDYRGGAGDWRSAGQLRMSGSSLTAKDRKNGDKWMQMREPTEAVCLF